MNRLLSIIGKELEKCLDMDLIEKSSDKELEEIVKRVGLSELSRKPSLGNLPSDTLHEIFSHISPQTRSDISTTCKAFNEATQSEFVKKQGKQVFKVEVFYDDNFFIITFKNKYIEGGMGPGPIEFDKKTGKFCYRDDIVVDDNANEEGHENFININDELNFTFSYTDDSRVDNIGSTVSIKIDPSNYVPQLKEAVEDANKQIKSYKKSQLEDLIEDFGYNYIYINKKGYLCGKMK
jgi:hypothetical protein